MARTGRPPKPVEQHKKTGTFRPDRHAALAVVPSVQRHEVFEPDASAIEIFERVLDSGVHWLGATDLPTLVMIREVLEKREQVGHDIKQWLELTKLAHQLLAQCGFDPASRSRLGLAEVKAMSKMEQLRAARDKHAAEVADTGQ